MSAYAEFIERSEDTDGVRFAWNVFPNSKVEATNIVVPTSFLITPLKEQPELPAVKYAPVVCKKPECQAILNPFCQCDFESFFWVCSICGCRNQFPQQYKGMTAQHKPADLQYSTLEYTLRRRATVRPVFLYVMDLCVDGEDLEALKETLQMSLSLLPPESLVGLITFGTTVQLHELGVEGVSKSFVFRGTKEYSTAQLQKMLGLVQAGGGAPRAAGAAPSAAQGAGRFLQPVSQCEYSLMDIIGELQCDPWPIGARKRALRSTGAALSVAVGLMEAAFPSTGGRIMLFTGGPATQGPGAIASDEQKITIRTHHDIERENPSAAYYKKAARFYEGLAQRAATNGHIVDLYACHFDQTGLYEMRFLPNFTGGHIVMGDSFNTSLFKLSFQRVFGKDERDEYVMGFNATFKVKASRELKVLGLDGPVVSAGEKGPNVSDSPPIGCGGTQAWKLCHIDNTTTLAGFLEVANIAGQPIKQGSQAHIQFITEYQHSSGEYRVRVTTVARNWADPSINLAPVVDGFDQNAACVLMARYGIIKSNSGDGQDVLRWLDRQLIKLCQKFGQYQAENPLTFTLPATFDMYPAFMFHLRRSQFLQVFNASPDESSYYHHKMCRETCENALTMIQPVLTSYSFSGDPTPVLLDSTSIREDTILLLDTFFHILIYHGKTIAQWRDANYHEKPEYENFKTLLQAPRDDAAEILQDRFPMPRYIDCDEGGSQARFLLAKVNPSVTHNSAPGVGDAGAAAAVITDDVSLQVFMEHLKKLAVSPSP